MPGWRRARSGVRLKVDVLVSDGEATALSGEPVAHAVTRSSDGDGITVYGDAHCRLRARGDVRGVPGEMPDEPVHLPLDPDRVFRPRRGAEAAVPQGFHVMRRGHGRAGRPAFR
jgi:hypothetical protein